MAATSQGVDAQQVCRQRGTHENESHERRNEFCSVRREGGRSEGDTKTMRDASCCSFERRGGVGSGKPLKARLVTTKVMRDAAKTHELLLPPEMLEASSHP